MKNLWVLLLFFSFGLFSKNIDSLFCIIKKQKLDTSFIKACIELGDYYEYYKIDSAIYYYNKAIEISDLLLKKNYYNHNEIARYKSNAIFYTCLCYYKIGEYSLALENCYLAKNIKEKISDAKLPNVLLTIGNIYLDKGNYSTANFYYNQTLKIAGQKKDTLNIISAYISIGTVYFKKGQYDKSLVNYISALKLAEKINNEKRIAICLNNIGNVHTTQKNYEEALKYYIKTGKLLEKLNDKKRLSILYTNIGNIYYLKDEYEKSLYYYNLSHKIREEIGDKVGLVSNYINIGNIYKKHLKQYIKAKEFYEKSLNLVLQIQDSTNIAEVYHNLGELYIFMYMENKNNLYLEKAYQFIYNSLKISKSIGNLSLYNSNLYLIAEYYEHKNDLSKTLYYLQEYIKTKDSLFSQEKTEALIEAEKKFETEKKQLIIDKLNKENQLKQLTIEKQRLENRNKKRVIVFSFIISGIIFFSLIIVLNQLKITKRQKKIIEKQKRIVEEKNSLLEQQNFEIKKQRDMLEQQNIIISEQQKQLHDSISYAKRIQHVVLEKEEIFKKSFKDYFLIYKPLEIVSGDFYWITVINEWVLFALADCTGHGVPGAFMSMLGISALNDIVRRREISQANQVLDCLRMYIIEMLQQKDETAQQKDGMDIAFCAYNSKTKELQYAGANIPLYIIHDGKLIEIEPDKQPAAIYLSMKEFKNNILKISENTTIFLTSDGFIDQFGGEKNKKYTRKRFKDLIFSIYNEPCEVIKQKIENEFNVWKGENSQIDDVTVLGIKF